MFFQFFALFAFAFIFLVPAQVLASGPVCDQYQEAGAAFAKGEFEKALAGYQACLENDPNDPKLHFLVGLAHENQGHFEKASQHWLKAVELDPFYREFLKDRYDASVNGIGRGVIHDHFGQKFCFGLFYVTPDKIVFRSLWGFPRLGTDDSFETPISNVKKVEVVGKERGKGWISNMPKRVELHYRFNEKIRGSVDTWERDEMKFFYGVTQISQTDLDRFAQQVLLYLQSKGVSIEEN